MKNLSAEQLFYQVGKIIWIPLLIIGIWFGKLGGFETYGDLLACSFRRTFGIICPGCGGTRAVYSLFRGEILESIRFHPAVFYMVLVYAHFMIRCFLRRHIYPVEKVRKEIKIERYAYVLIIIIILQWVIKIALAVSRALGLY